MDRKKATEIEIKQLMQINLESHESWEGIGSLTPIYERKNVKAKLVAKICLINVFE